MVAASLLCSLPAIGSAQVRETHNLPSLRRGKALGVTRTEVIAVRLRRLAEGPEYRHRIRVYIGKGRNGVLAARDFAARSTGHCAITLCMRDAEQAVARRSTIGTWPHLDGTVRRSPPGQGGVIVTGAAFEPP
jgi:hypothetical protein